MFKKWTTTLLAILLSVATLGATAIPGFAKTATGKGTKDESETGKSYNLTLGAKVARSMGRAGISMAKSPYSGELDLSRSAATTSNHMRVGSIDFVAPLLNWMVEDKNEKPVSYVGGASVFFNLNKNQLAQWKAHTLAIYYFNGGKKSWTKLPTAWSNSGTSGKGRLSAATIGFGTYGLGMAK
jgi:hypothetical protein